MDRLMKKALLIIAIVLAVLFLMTACRSELKDPFADFSYEKEEETVKTVPVVRRDIEITNTVFAKSIPRAQTVQYYDEVTGYFKEYVIPLLSDVKAGDVIAVLDSSTLDKQIRDQFIKYEKVRLKYEKAKLEFETTGDNENAMLTAKLDYEYEKLKYDELLIQYDALELKAEIDGQVTKMQADPGDFINGSSPICEITDDSEIFISFSTEYGQGLGVGDILQVDIRNSTEVVNAEIIEITSGEIILKPEYIHTSFAKTGTLVYISMLVDKRIDTLVIEDNCVVEEAGRFYVFVVEDGVMSERDIKTGISNDGYVEVLFGLEEGEQVVSNPY
jgi:multidrug efflux pump subunit AcrA (membrane-fusion protein)